MHRVSCPTGEQLTAYASGRLGAEAHQQMDWHVDECRTCQSTLETLDASPGEPLLAVLRASPDAQVEDASFRAMVDRAKAMTPLATPRPPGESTEDAWLPAGTRLAGYEIIEPLGEGGMGRVYRASHQSMRREVALKVLSPSWLGNSEAKRRFQREAQAAARLKHPNIVAAYDAGQADGICYLAMEFVPGRDLSQVVKQNGPLPPEAALDYLRQAAAGLQYAHKQNIIHRDIKPGNLLLDDQGVVKVLDMGIARASLSSSEAGGPDSRDLTASRALLGTAAFMAPEQAANPRNVDGRTDIYSLGCTFFYLLTGKQVYEGETAMEVVFAHREQPVPSLAGHLEHCPAAVDRLFQNMIAKRPGDRPADMAEVIVRINQLLDRNGTVGTAAKPRSLPHKFAGVRLWGVGVAAALLVIFGFFYFGDMGSGSGEDKGNSRAAGEIKNELGQTASKLDKPKPPGSPWIAMATIPDGEFWMGAALGDKNAPADQKPRHKVRISSSFQLGKFEITRDQFAEVMGLQRQGKDGSRETRDNDGRHAIVGVRWLLAIEFCNRLSRRHGLEPYYAIKGETVTIKGGDGFRLPTEAEWEYACRAGSQSKWHFGDDPAKLDEFDWHAGNSGGRVKPVGKLKPNRWGLFDMHGNAPEWCWDRYDPNYYAKSEAKDPPGSGDHNIKQRVIRGGSTSHRAAQTTASSRTPLGSTYGTVMATATRKQLPPLNAAFPGARAVGLRVARSVHGGQAAAPE